MMTDDQLDEMDLKSYPRTIDNFCRALQILKGLSDKTEYLLQGEHDEIYVFAGPPTSDEQQIELDRLSFRYDEECESWKIYT
jgi:hypothetical protein